MPSPASSLNQEIKLILRNKQRLYLNISNSLSRREESSKHKLCVCLLACLCVHRVKRTSKTDFEEKTFLEVIRCGEFESAVSFN
jgi:hypothetical protein